MAASVRTTGLDSVLNTIVDGVIIIDKKGAIQRYNPACVRIFGYSVEEVLGKNVSVLMPEPDHSAHDSYLHNYQSSGEAKIIGIGREVKGLRKSGEVFPMYLSVGEMPGGTNGGFVGIIRDLTIENERATAFDELQQQHFHLSRISAMNQMGAAIAHELNQPLTAIMNYLEAGMAILDRANFSDANMLQSVMKKSSEQAHRAAQILSRLRQFIETGDVEKSQVDVTETINKALELIRLSFKNKSIDFQINVPEDIPGIWGNSVQIQQVLVNLMRNGCEAMEHSAEKNLVISARRHEGNMVEIKVSDTGLGMSDENFDTLFKPFSSSKDGGLGVGLSISQTIVDNHEGQLWAEHNSPNGTNFYITIPVGHD